MQYRIPLLFLFLPLLLTGQQAALKVNLGHTGPINSLRFSPDSRYLISSSDDKTMKLWDVNSGKLLKTSPAIPYGPFNRKLFFFPEQQLVTYFTGDEPGNWYNWTWNLQKNELKDGRSLSARPSESFRPLKPESQQVPSRDYESELWGKSAVDFLGNTATPIYFTNGVGTQSRGYFPDAKYLYRRSGDTLYFSGIWEEQNFSPTIYPGLPEIFSFNSAGNLIFGSDAGPTAQQVTFWNVQTGAVFTSGNLPANNYLNDISPDGKFLLLTNTSGTSSIYDLAQNQTIPIGEGTQLSPVGADERMIVFDQAMFSPDGRWIARGGTDGAIYLHEVATRKVKRVLKGYTQVVTDVSFSEGGAFINCQMQDNSLRAWDLSKRLLKTSQTNPSKAPAKLNGEIGRSKDGQLAIIESESGMLELWNLSNRQKVKDIGDAETLAPSNNRIRGADISPDKSKVFFYCRLRGRRASTTYLLWDLTNNQRIADIPISISVGGANTVGFSPDSKYLLIADGEGGIITFDIKASSKTGTFSAHENTVSQISFSSTKPNQFLTTTQVGNGTVKIWELGKTKPLATLINLDKEDWVVVGDGGMFDASTGAMQLLFYEVENNGNVELVELEQLKARYYEPGLLQKILGLSDERIRSVEGLRDIALYPSVSTQIENDQLAIQLQARSGGIGKVSLFANGKEVENDINPQRQANINYDLRKTHKFLIKKQGANNVISLRVFNQEGWLKSGAIDIPYQPTAWARGNDSGGTGSALPTEQDPSMYVVTIGTSNYNGDRLDLSYADQDATIMARAAEAAGGRLFQQGEKLEVYCLTTAKQDSTGLENTQVKWQFANKKNIQAVLKSLESKAKPEDILVIYLSGHGLSYGTGETNQFYYLTHEIASEEMLSSSDSRQQYTVSSGELTEWMKAIPALKQVLVIDACNSGKVVEELTTGTRNLNSSQIRALDRMKDRTGMFVLSGSAADKVSYEASEFGQGLLTYALLQGMRGVATRQTADGNYVDVMKLFQYARDEVPRLAESISGIQTPMMAFPNQGASFDIGIVDNSVNIPIANKKPVLIRSKFLNQETLDDDLNLEGLLESRFRKETEKGKDADFIYVNVPKYPGAFKLSGLYTKQGDSITINVNLFEEGGATKKLEIPATDDPDRLVKLILREVKKALR